jgi:hypothetical protein
MANYKEIEDRIKYFVVWTEVEGGFFNACGCADEKSLNELVDNLKINCYPSIRICETKKTLLKQIKETEVSRSQNVRRHKRNV